MENKKVFISYSWDSKSHQQWVLNLVNQLRKNGIDADADIFETQMHSVNLPQMMVNRVRDSDFVIIVLSENYAHKANQSSGGVGFESRLILPLLMENPNKLIYIMRHEGDFEKVFPFHLKGQHAIDFSNDSEYEEKFNDLIYRIYGEPRYYKEPLGKPPVFTPRVPQRFVARDAEKIQKKDMMDVDFSDLNLPNLKRITDQEIDRFLKASYKELISLFNKLFTQINSMNQEFDFDQDEIDNYKTVFYLYINGKKVNGIKVWYGSIFGNNTINLSYGSNINMSDNSMNETITHDIDNNNKLGLKMMINMFGEKGVMTSEEVVKEVWRNHLSHSIK